MMKCVALLTMIALTACGEAPQRFVAVDTLCSSTTRFHASEEQRAAFKANPALFGSLVDWLFGFNKVRDGECLKAPSGQ